MSFIVLPNFKRLMKDLGRDKIETNHDNSNRERYWIVGSCDGTIDPNALPFKVQAFKSKITFCDQKREKFAMLIHLNEAVRVNGLFKTPQPSLSLYKETRSSTVVSQYLSSLKNAKPPLKLVVANESPVRDPIDHTHSPNFFSNFNETSSSIITTSSSSLKRSRDLFEEPSRFDDLDLGGGTDSFQPREEELSNLLKSVNESITIDHHGEGNNNNNTSTDTTGTTITATTTNSIWRQNKIQNS